VWARGPPCGPAAALGGVTVSLRRHWTLQEIRGALLLHLLLRAIARAEKATEERHTRGGLHVAGRSTLPAILQWPYAQAVLGDEW